MPLSRSRRRRPMSEINVVPYIDVMLVLLVIFMVTAPLLQQAVEVDLPNEPAQTLSEGTEEQQPVIVEVTAAGDYLVVDEQGKIPVDARSLGEAVRSRLAADRSRPVYVGGDEQVGYGRVVHALVALKNAGIDGVGLLTEPPGDAEAAP